jgi:ATP-binding cassette subfamily G (WHITE) protein 2 (PDR)
MSDEVDESHVYRGFNGDVSDEIHQLARTISRAHQPLQRTDSDRSSIHSTMSHHSSLNRRNSAISDISMQIPIGDNVNPKLDPELPEFDSRYWVRNTRKIIDLDPNKYKIATLGVAYKNLRAYGTATDADYQANFGNAVGKYVGRAFDIISGRAKRQEQFDILKPMDGVIKPGELTVVLGRPGAGCLTFLKTIAAQTYGFHIDRESQILYKGLTPKEISKHYRADVVYCAETENHFPHLTVGQTLEFAARLRTPQTRPDGVTREQYATHMASVIMATYGLLHTRNTKVGNDYVRGVSGGERKRVSIAEVALNHSALQCWDNSTRGLDSATALEFVNALKCSAQVMGATPLVAIYQCSQDAFDLFDKVILMYEGYQIYLGGCARAREFFQEMGYECPPRQVTADYLTSLTNPAERVVREGFDPRALPQTPEEFYDYWRQSLDYRELMEEVDATLARDAEDNHRQLMYELHKSQQSNHIKPLSPYTVSYMMQVRYVMTRNFQRTRGDPLITLFQVIGNTLMGLIISSIFYNLPSTTSSFYLRLAALFFALLFNAFSSLLEIFALYESRPIVEKHQKFGLYHPSADAFASIITELPAKIITCIAFNLILYFMVNFRRDPGHFFYFLLLNFVATLVMSHLFRAIGAATKSLSQAMTPASVLLLAITVFTGFIIPTPKMHGWCRWINYIDPLAYTFEALMANEFALRRFDCTEFVPRGPGYPTSGANIVCSAVGSRPGQPYVEGTDYIASSYEYYHSHRWRNFGITVGYVIFLLCVYLIIVEYNKGARQKGEVLLFQRHALKQLKKQKVNIKDIESGPVDPSIKKDNDSSESPSSDEKVNVEKVIPANGRIFHWRDITYEVQIKTETRTILNSIDGWVKPGQVTALMGASGAGKTTLLNALSDRLTSGLVTNGTRMVNGCPLDASFQRSIGYVQQQDLHLQTSTVREALTFSAYMRQPELVPKAEKDASVDEVIKLLDMEKYSDAVVGVAGEGLNVEQRKRLTIGVELVAKPKLLIFLDEPTSGLDSQTAWSICKLIRKLADAGQAILCTIHQPSAILLQEFDRLLFLQKGGQTVYFGDLGPNCQTLIDYFEKIGSNKCPPDANPAEWMLQIIGAAPGSHADQDYYEAWKNSDEYQSVMKELDYMETELPKIAPVETTEEDLKTFAIPVWKQYLLVTKRVFEQYWRTPSYIYSKVLLAVISALFNGFAFFKADKSMQGLQNQMFSVFMFFVIFLALVQQYLPHFVFQRDLYEVRERPSKTFSWVAFICAQITAEVPWQALTGTLAFFSWYYPIGFYNNAVPTNTVNQRGGFMWFTIVVFFIYCSTMAQVCISFIEVADNAANLATLLFSLCLAFCGVMVKKEDLPGFWIFMYRCSPFTYLVSVILANALAKSPVVCASNELLVFKPVKDYTCSQYLGPYMKVAGGYLLDENAKDYCQFCPMKTTDVFLDSIHADYDKRGRNIGIFICFIAINVIATILFYYLARVPHGDRRKESRHLLLKLFSNLKKKGHGVIAKAQKPSQ